MIYVNNAGTSWPKAPGVAEAVGGAMRLAPAELGATYGAGHRMACEFLGIEHRDRFLFTGGCTSALALAIPELPWGEGDVVVTSSLEHHALARQVERLAMERGVVHEQLPYRPGGVDPGDLEAVLQRGRVRLVAMTHASNVTGEVLPVPELVQRTHAHDALFLLDAAQSVGVLPVDASELGVDVLVFAGHKGPLGPLGIGGLYAAPGVEFRCPWATCEIGEDGRSRDACGSFFSFCDVGSANMPALAGLAAGVQWLAAQGEELGVHPRALAASLASRLESVEGVRVLGTPGAARTATLGLSVDSLALDRAESFFAERGITLRAGSHCAPMALEALGVPQGCLRISFGPFNAETDVDAIVDACDEANRG